MWYIALTSGLAFEAAVTSAFPIPAASTMPLLLTAATDSSEEVKVRLALVAPLGVRVGERV